MSFVSDNLKLLKAIRDRIREGPKKEMATPLGTIVDGRKVTRVEYRYLEGDEKCPRVTFQRKSRFVFEIRLPEPDDERSSLRDVLNGLFSIGQGAPELLASQPAKERLGWFKCCLIRIAYGKILGAVEVLAERESAVSLGSFKFSNFHSYYALLVSRGHRKSVILVQIISTRKRKSNAVLDGSSRQRENMSLFKISSMAFEQFVKSSEFREQMSPYHEPLPLFKTKNPLP